MTYIKNWRLFEGEYDVFDNKSRERFWGDVAAGILPICSKTGRILLGLRSKEVNEPLTWGLFGGKMESGEDPRQAAKRELVEESEYEGEFELIKVHVFKSPSGGFTYHNFIGIVEEEFEPTLGWETERAEWMSYEKFIKITPKHFGLKELIEKDGDKIRRYAVKP